MDHFFDAIFKSDFFHAFIMFLAGYFGTKHGTKDGNGVH